MVAAQVTVTVLTSRYGDVDPIVTPPAQTVDVDWVCVTDNPDTVPGPWRCVVEPRPHLTPRMAAKLARCRPDLYTDTDICIWLDASARIQSPDTVGILVDVLGEGLLAMFRHPERNNIVDEATVGASMAKYQCQPLAEQVAHYRKQGFVDIGLWATGCIVSRPHHLRDLGSMWLIEMLRWGTLDQVSLPYVLAWHDIRPVDIPGSLWANPLVTFDYTRRRHYR